MNYIVLIFLILSCTSHAMDNKTGEDIWKNIAKLEHEQNKASLSRTLAGLAQNMALDSEDEMNLPKLKELGLDQLSQEAKNYIIESYQPSPDCRGLDFVKLDDPKTRFLARAFKTGMEKLLDAMLADKAHQCANPK